MAGMFGSSGLAGLANTSSSSQNTGGDNNVNTTNQNYLWKTASYQLQNPERSLVVKVIDDDNIIIDLPSYETADDGQSHFVGNLDRSLKSISVRSNCNIEDNENQISLEPGTGYEFVLKKSETIWIPFSR